jgi:5-methylthioribose kinase
MDLTPENVSEYLHYPCKATLLGGGVSNTVLLVEGEGRRFILKQSLAKLKVEQDWFSDRVRIFRESAALRELAPLLPEGSVPQVLFEDRENFLFAMTIAPAAAKTWKEELLRGQVDVSVAERVAHLLGAMIAKTWENERLAEEFGDQTIFDQLRLDPYYRATALRHPDLIAPIENMMAASSKRRVSLVHGDWSPKNFLVAGDQVMAIDFEVIHYGDPSFDSAFMLNHLLLKAFYFPARRTELQTAALRFWETLVPYVPRPNEWFERATLAHLGGLMLARIDGKSPVEYIKDESLRTRIRAFARALIQRPPGEVAAVVGAVG